MGFSKNPHEQAGSKVFINKGTFREPVWEQVYPNPFEAPPSLEKERSPIPRRNEFVRGVDIGAHASILGSVSTSLWIIHTNHNMYRGAGYDLLPLLYLIAAVGLFGMIANIYDYCKRYPN